MLLQLEGLTVRFGGVEALCGVDLALPPRSSLGVMGPNGCGKTTLFNVVTGLIPAQNGRILFRGLDIGGRPAHDIARRGIARTFQTVRLFDRLTVLENVTPVVSPIDPQKVERLLEQMGLGTKRNALAAELSLNEQRRLEIARALAHSPHLVLMDEPTAGLDPLETEEMVSLIRDVVLPAHAVILTEHKPNVIPALCPVAILLDQGRKVAQGSPAELLAS